MSRIVWSLIYVFSIEHVVSLIHHLVPFLTSYLFYSWYHLEIVCLTCRQWALYIFSFRTEKWCLIEKEAAMFSISKTESGLKVYSKTMSDYTKSVPRTRASLIIHHVLRTVNFVCSPLCYTCFYNKLNRNHCMSLAKYSFILYNLYFLLICRKILYNSHVKTMHMYTLEYNDVIFIIKF